MVKYYLETHSLLARYLVYDCWGVCSQGWQEVCCDRSIKLTRKEAWAYGSGMGNYFLKDAVSNGIVSAREVCRLIRPSLGDIKVLYLQMNLMSLRWNFLISHLRRHFGGMSNRKVVNRGFIFLNVNMVAITNQLPKKYAIYRRASPWWIWFSHGLEKDQYAQLGEVCIASTRAWYPVWEHILMEVESRHLVKEDAKKRELNLEAWDSKREYKNYMTVTWDITGFKQIGIYPD